MKGLCFYDTTGTLVSINEVSTPFHAYVFIGIQSAVDLTFLRWTYDSLPITFSERYPDLIIGEDYHMTGPITCDYTYHGPVLIFDKYEWVPKE